MELNNYYENGKIYRKIIPGESELTYTGNEYNKQGYMVFKGEFLNGQKNGYGECYQDGVIVCKGTYKNDMKHGEIIHFNERLKCCL